MLLMVEVGLQCLVSALWWSWHIAWELEASMVLRICHRNLTAENILMLTTQPIEKNVAKVTGFSYACYLKKRQVSARTETQRVDGWE
eukprot:738674-Amphidinium_carterae.1